MTIPSVAGLQATVAHDETVTARRFTPQRTTAPPDKASANASEVPEPHETAPAPKKVVSLPDFPHYDLQFRLDEEHGRVVVQVIDSKTGTVVRTVPPESLAKSLRTLAEPRGLLHDSES
ncbi:MAG TPA: flagellar protein FlaG [Candidatus Binatia bacterium]|jgi:uncharacterized FlaG/YvyC family protein